MTFPPVSLSRVIRHREGRFGFVIVSLQLATLLAQARLAGALDILLVPGRPPLLALPSDVVAADAPPLKPEEVAAAVRELAAHRIARAAPHQDEDLREASFVAVVTGVGRLRVTVFRQRGQLALVLRPVAPAPPPLESLGLPPALPELLRRRRGLILVAGPSAAGKTTTLAAMVDFINRHLARHIVSIENPVEYAHHPLRSVISQRSIPDDTPSYARAVRAALRQAPDVLVVGDVHDRETAEAALAAAEAGHLVIAAVHSKDAADAVARLQSQFPPQQRAQVAVQLANTLTAVVVQQLLTRRDRAGRVLATEFLLGTGAVRHVVRTGEFYRLNTFIQAGRPLGMHTMEDSLVQLALSGTVDYGEAITATADAGLFFNLYRKRLRGDRRRGIGRVIMSPRDELVLPPAGAYGLTVSPEGSSYRSDCGEDALPLWASNGLLACEDWALCYRPDPFQPTLYAQLTDYSIWLGARPPFRLNHFVRAIVRARPEEEDHGYGDADGAEAAESLAGGGGDDDIREGVPRRTRVWVVLALDQGTVATLPAEGEPGVHLPLDDLWHTLYFPVPPDVAGRAVRAYALRFSRPRIVARVREVLFV